MSWSIPMDQPSFLARKKVDWSVFQYGIHVPLNLKDRFLQAVGSEQLGRGEKVDVQVVLEGKVYSAALHNINRQGVHSDTIQIRYDGNKELRNHLVNLFAELYTALERSKGADAEVAGDLLESRECYLDVYSNGQPRHLHFVPIARRLKTMLDGVLDGYEGARSQSISSERPMVQLLQRDLPGALHDLMRLEPSRHKLQGSAGQGNWAAVPWVAIIDREVTESIQSGVYMVYLFCADMKAVYLSLMMGVTELTRQNSGRSGLQLLKQRASGIRSVIGLGEQEWLAPVLGESSLAKKYEAGMITCIKYDKGSVPEDHQLLQDLGKVMELYGHFKREMNTPGMTEEKSALQNEPLSAKEALTHVHRFINAAGFQYSFSDLANFFLSLRTKPFVLLAGISGTGKTQLPRLFAKSIMARSETIAVRPDWNDGSDLLGYCDLEGRFRPGALTRFIEMAGEEPDIPFLVVLDEMNLARVEHYMSDVLSVMETRDLDQQTGWCSTDPVLGNMDFKHPEDEKRFKSLLLPPNLYIVGTVNMDETTHPFSKKVLDRANTIEFSTVDLSGYRRQSPEPVDAVSMLNGQLAGRFTRLAHGLLVDREYIDRIVDKLSGVNHILTSAGLHVGYRVRDELAIYMLHNRQLDLLDEDTAFDFQLVQKILPRLQGSSQHIRHVLIQLLKTCSGVDLANANDDLLARLHDLEIDGRARPYPRSTAKLVGMLRRFEEDGFTSYWI